MAETADVGCVTVRHEDAKAFVVALLEAVGVSKKYAETVAQGLVQADLRGVESHGINRIPSYLARIRNGVLDPKAEPTLTQVTPVVAQVSERASCPGNGTHETRPGMRVFGLQAALT